MNGKPAYPRKVRLFYIVLLVTLVAQLMPAGNPGPAEAYDFVDAMSNVIPFAGFFNAFRGRNRVYREANTFIDERKDYYDRLQNKARELYVERDLAPKNRSQTGAYTKVTVLIAKERKATLDFAESKKKAAREEFLDKFEKAILARVLNSGAAQRLIKAISSGIRAAQGKLDEAIGQLTGESGGFLGELAKIRRQANRMHVLAGAIGGRGGSQIARTMSGLVRTIDNTTGTFTEPLMDVNADLGNMADMMESLESKNLVAMGAETPNDFVIRLIDADADDPVLDAILGVLDQKSGKGDGSIREQARQKILAGFIIRCAQMGSQYQNLLAEMEAGIESDGEDGERDVSLCQAVADLMLEGKDLESAVQEVEGKEETADEPEGPYLKFLFVEGRDGWCFPELEGLENEICGYTLEWRLEYSAPGATAGLRCTKQGADIYLGEDHYSETVRTPSGIWEHTMNTGGFYPALGDYIEHLTCEMYDPNITGDLVTQVEADIVAPLTSVRQP